MRKILVALSLFLIPLFLLAEEWPYVCSASELPQFKKSDIFGASIAYIIHVDTAKVNKSNKTIKVWETHIVDSKTRNEYIGEFGDKYQNYGYFKWLQIYDIQNDRFKTLSITYYKCDGDPIATYTPKEPTWVEIVPGSVAEGNLKALKQKFKF